MTVKLGVGIIGIGVSRSDHWTGYEWSATGNGLYHAEAIYRNPNLHTVALCDVVEDGLQDAGQKLGISNLLTDYRDLVVRPDVDIVVISTPNASHAEIALAALAAGKHVVLEKPMCITLDDCQRLITASEASGTKFLVNHIQRFAPRFRETRRLAHKGALGQLFYGESAVVRNLEGLIRHGWRGQGSERHTPMMGNGSHAIDLLRWIFGEVAEVTGVSTGRNAEGIDVPFDMCEVALLTFDSGAVGRVLGIHLCAAPMIYQLQVWGTEGTVIDDKLFLKTEEERQIDFTIRWDPARPCDPVYEHFVDCIVRDRQPLIDVFEAANTVAVALAADEAIATGVKQRPARFDRRASTPLAAGRRPVDVS